jgi:hypothetical protein
LSLALDKFMGYLAVDGVWHSINELVAYLHLEKSEVGKIAKFFAYFRFIQLDESQRKVKIQPNMRKLFASPMEEMERIPLIVKR